MNPRAEKFLRIILCPSAPDGEALAAVVALRRLLVDGSSDPIARLSAMLSSQQAPAPDAVFPFGAHKGEPVSEVACLHPDYVVWFSSLTNLSPGLRGAVRYWARVIQQQATAA